jgi:hypothetical protein
LNKQQFLDPAASDWPKICPLGKKGQAYNFMILKTIGSGIDAGRVPLPTDGPPRPAYSSLFSHYLFTDGIYLLMANT